MSERAMDSSSSVPVARTAGLVAVLGTWIFWSGVFLTGFGWIITLNVLVGATIAAIGAYTAGWPSGGPLPGPALLFPVVTLLLGLVVIALPFLLNVTDGRMVWSNVIAGALVVVLSGASVYGSWQLSGTATRA
ncbi:SPW repeat domain-containing protein [Halosolutus halophilus]|uniref:SPW repeat domain-containing protein n=1 Tax=Halosolutus halophilus TaxID=1552990 RepID=UPI002235264F|nr:hypothetical protein [Halosolutus halophilus]